LAKDLGRVLDPARALSVKMPATAVAPVRSAVTAARQRAKAAATMGELAGPLRVATKGRFVAIALGVGLLVLAIGTSVESAVAAAFRPSGVEVRWISEVIAASVIVGGTYLSLRLSAVHGQLLDMERDRIAVGEQLRLAAEIQRRTLPAIPTEALNYRWAARMVPAYDVGGDFYDFLVLSEDTVAVMLADVSGKGIPAALLPSALKTLFHVHARATADLAAVAARMSAGLREDTDGVPYATAILARFDRQPPRMTFVNAGHPPGFLIRDGDPIALESTGMPLGLWPDAQYDAVSIDLRPGDLGVFMTDGVTEALEGGAFSIHDALIQAARSGLEDPADLCAYLMRIAGAGAGPLGADGWQDDRTSLAFRVLPTRPSGRVS
jgi:Stage II sporulation protein E (SpoIIE)